MNKKDKYRLSYKKSMLDDLKLGQLDNDYKKIIENYSIKKNDMKPVKMSKYDEKNIIMTIEQEKLNSRLDKKQKDFISKLNNIDKIKEIKINEPNLNLYDYLKAKKLFSNS